MAAATMTIPMTCATRKMSLFSPSPATLSRPAAPRAGRLRVRASLKEKAVTGLTAAALTASMVIPDVAEAAESGGVPPSLKNFLLSIVAGGVVLTAIIGAVVGVSNFDPVNRT